jgi:hypothetical protein
MWVVIVLGAVVVAAVVGRQLWKRRSRGPHSIDMGNLSDSWLAEHRGSRDGQS